MSESPELPQGSLEPGFCVQAPTGAARGSAVPAPLLVWGACLRTTGETGTELPVLVTGHPVHRRETEARRGGRCCPCCFS